MADYDYGQLLDDFELGVDVMPDEDLTAYIERRRREFESKADGGSIGIEVLFQPKREDFNIGGNVQRATTPKPYDSRATVADFARAIDRVGAGTDSQKAMDIQRYGENVRRQNIMNKFVNQPSFLGPATQQAAKNLNQGVLASQSALDMLNKTMTPFEPTLEPDRILEIVEQQKAAGVPETGLITNFKPTMADVSGPSTTTANTIGTTKTDPFYNQLQLSGAVTLDEALDYAKRRGDPQVYSDFLTREYNTMQQTPIDYLVREEKYKDASKSDITNELTRIYNQTLPQYRSADTLDKYISDYYKTNPYYADGGRVGMLSGGALKTVGSGIMKLFSKGDDVVDLAKQEEIFRSGDITTDFLEKVDDKVIKKFITTRDTKGPGGYGMYDNFDDMPNGLKAAELISRIKTADGGINYEAAELFIGKKLKGDETVDELIKMVIKKPGLTDSPLKDFENYVLKSENLADGGRVGLFMGGDPLTGQALSIYDSMKAYNFSDQEIANALSAQGLYTAGGTTDTPDTTIQPIGFQSGNGGGGGGITELDPLNRPKGTPFDLNSLTKTKFGYNNTLGRTIEGVKDFTGSMIDKFSGSKIGEGITEGATKFKNFAITPMMALMNKRNPLNPDAMNYNPNLQKQMDFLEGQTGTRVFGTSDNLQFEDAAMIGRDPNSGLAKYGPGSVLSGQNVVSGFGTNDYEQQLANYISKMRNYKTLTNFQKEKLEQAKAEVAKEIARREQETADRARAANPGVYASADRQGFTDGKGGGFGSKSTGTNESFSNKSGRGRTGYSEGGLATMFTRRR